MLLTRIYLRNYRVYEDELNLELPPGLLGIYGVNGAGKSALLESILWTLWGKARTAKEEVRTAGVGADCVTEVEFEHEGHLYLVRRTLSGANSTVRAEAHCDNLIMAEGARDTGRYVHQVLGMDDAAFRASVFAEQKQLAAFSSQSTAERRKLILQLLGITPLDGARDSARKDARVARERHDHLRGVLPDVDSLATSAADTAAAAGAAEVTAIDEESAAAVARERLGDADAAFVRLDARRQTYDRLVGEGRAARASLDAAVKQSNQLGEELTELDAASAKLAELAPAAEGAELFSERLGLLKSYRAARSAVQATELGDEPPEADEGPYNEARSAAEEVSTARATSVGQLGALRSELSRAREQSERSAELSGAGECPICGQALGEAFERVQTHRAAEVALVSARLDDAQAEADLLAGRVEQSRATLEASQRLLEQARRERTAWDQTLERRRQAEQVLASARQALAELKDPGLEDQQWRARVEAFERVDLTQLSDEVEALDAEVVRRRGAARESQRLRGRLDRREALLAQRAAAAATVSGAELEVSRLLDQVKTLGYDKADLDATRQTQQSARATYEQMQGRAQQARIDATRARTEAEGESKRLDDARRQHAQLAEIATDALHLGRLAELLNAFRNTVVATVGPRLAVQAAELFAELTDREYDRLEVDPDTYGIQIRDAGRLYGLERFSGSEVDLANLALRVAISDHVRFQSGGSVGLLVLDEVFGPLDEDRKARMLLALERLRGRFRQVLVVTHDNEIKEQLPGAIEVLKLPGRRATARLMA